MMLFPGRQATELGPVLERLAADSSTLGEGWRLMGRGPALPGPLLFATPAGELAVCLIAPILEASHLSAGRALLAKAVQALPLLQACPPEGLPAPRAARLLLIGGAASADLLAASSPEWTLCLVCEVTGQPGPPLVLFRPLAASGPAPVDPPVENAEAPWPAAGELADEEVARLLAGEEEA